MNLPDIGQIIEWKVAMFRCPCGEELARFGPTIHDMPTLEYRCGHTWGNLGFRVGAKRLPDWAVRDFYVNEMLRVMSEHRSEVYE